MVEAPQKVPISAKLDGSRTAHLQPLIDYLAAQGNAPAGPGAFSYDRDGYGSFYFTEALDMVLLRAHFAFPATIILTKDTVQDSRNFVGITQASPGSTPLLFNV